MGSPSPNTFNPLCAIWNRILFEILPCLVLLCVHIIGKLNCTIRATHSYVTHWRWEMSVEYLDCFSLVKGEENERLEGICIPEII